MAVEEVLDSLGADGMMGAMANSGLKKFLGFAAAAATAVGVTIAAQKKPAEGGGTTENGLGSFTISVH